MRFFSKLKGQRGQVMPLAAVSVLVLALMVFLNMNILRSVHERIRLQNYADSRAFSMAVQEARTFNFFAYSNRAIAGAYVALGTLHAWESEASMMADIDFTMMIIMGEVAGEEAALSAACFAEWDISGGVQHLIHSVEAGINVAGLHKASAEGMSGGGSITMRINWNTDGALSDSPCGACMGSLCDAAANCDVEIYLCNGPPDNMKKQKAPCHTVNHKDGSQSHKWQSKRWTKHK